MLAVANPHRPALNSAFQLVRGGVLPAFLLLSSFAAGAAAPAGIAERPLAARSAPRGATMFAELAPERTGIVTENHYSDAAMWGERYQEFVYGAIGTGLAIGDYDNDGRPDLFVVSKTEGCRLFRNLGDWKFEDVTERAGVSGRATSWADTAKSWLGLGGGTARSPDVWKQGATFADVNNDGRLDLYVCRFGTPNLLFLNQGDGTFKEGAAAAGLDVSDASNMAAFADYDRDGWLDVYLQTNLLDATTRPGGQRDHLFHNNGDGTFTNVTERAGIGGDTQGHSATWWDYDGDGWSDLYIANDFAPADTLYRNNRDGTFTNTLDRAVPHTPHSSMGADLGDVNNDGLIDLLVADMAATTHAKDHRGMAKIRTLLDDHVVAPGVAPQYMRGALFLNTGTARVLEAAQLAGLDATDWTWSVRFEDLDNDGRLDVHFTNGMVRELHNSDLVQRISASESIAEGTRLMKASPPLAEANLAYRNLGELEFENVGAAWGLDQKGVSFGAAFGDLDGDGDLDLVFTNYQRGVTVLRNDSDAGHRLVVALHGSRSNRFGVGATVRIETAAGVQVRQLVLARGYLASSEPILHFGLGDDAVVQRLTVTWPSGQTQTFTDLATNRHLTISEPAEAPPSAVATPEPPAAPNFTDVSAPANFSCPANEPAAAPGRQALLPMRQDKRGPALAIGDLNGDAHDDAVLGGTAEDPVRILFGDGSARFTTAAFSLAGSPAGRDGPLLVFEASGDGANDLLLTSGTQGGPRLFLNDGRGGFRPAAPDAFPALSTPAGAVTAADFDRDGRLDIFVGARAIPGQYPLPSHSALLLNRGGRFEDVTDALAPGLREIGIVNSALWTDVDGDGWLDLLVAVEWGGVRYWRNRAGRGFEDRSEPAGFSSAGTGWWTSLAAADFNGDGHPDYVAGNVGLNTPYRASAERPALLFHGVFSDGAPPLIVEAYHEGDRIYPRRSRQELGAKIPAILRRYPRNDGFARATLAEMVGEDRLVVARRFAATELRSGVFLSQPDGTHRFAPLPRVAQIAPLQGIAAGDFDGDGHADIYAVQNSFAPLLSIGRFDGGLSQLLLGDGRGGFSAVAVAESNLVVPGDAKALAVIDLNADGWADFLITRSGATSMAYLNTGVAGRHSLRIGLRGPAGNPSAIGARVTVEKADGTSQTTELYAGSGYASQSAAVCFVGYAEASPPRRVSVRWPSGQTSEHDVPASIRSLLLTDPSLE